MVRSPCSAATTRCSPTTMPVGSTRCSAPPATPGERPGSNGSPRRLRPGTVPSAGRARDDRRPRAERPRPGVRDGQRRRGTVRRGREPPDGASPRVDRRRPAAPRRRARRPPARHLSRRLDHGRAQGACHGDHPRARAVAARAVHRRLRLPRPAGRPGARARHPHGDRLGRRGALPRGRRHRRRLRSRARARGDVAQDRGAAPRARRRDGPQLRAVLVWLNGRLVDGARAHVSAFDRGLLHGDGAYDTWRTYAGRPFAVPAHVRRLAAAARALALPGPGAAALWERRTRVLVARTRLPDAALRLTLTRGATGDGLVPARRGRPTLLPAARPLPPDLARRPSHGVSAILLPFPRDAGPPWGNLKLVGHASAVAGRLAAVRRGADEGLYVTPAGEVTEGTTTN